MQAVRIIRQIMKIDTCLLIRKRMIKVREIYNFERYLFKTYLYL